MPKKVQLIHLSPARGNFASIPTAPLPAEQTRSRKAPKKKVRHKNENSTGMISARFEKHLQQSEKLHRNLWRTTTKSITEISQTIKLLKNLSQLSENSTTIRSSANDKRREKTRLNAKNILSKQNQQNLDAILKNRLDNLKTVKNLLRSSDLVPKKSISPVKDAESPKSKKVLIVDDDLISIKLTSHFLKNAGYAVSSAEDGKEGLQKALESPPDIVLIDIMMPGLDGFQLLTRLKKEPKTSKIPAVILSSLSNEKEILKGLKEGALDFITKPFSPQVLLAKIEKAVVLEKCICP